jgi:hypothetical protein
LQYVLVDPVGTQIASDRLEGGLNRIEIEGLPAGLYMVRLTDVESGVIYKGVRVVVID